jgi:hypothetical protein
MAEMSHVLVDCFGKTVAAYNGMDFVSYWQTFL